MKICITCKLELPLEDFPPNKATKDGLNSKCRSCYNKYMRDWYDDPLNKKKHINRALINNEIQLKKLRQFIWDYYSTHPCVICGENDPIVLQFDHLDRNNKLTNIATMVQRKYSIDTIKKEIAKCRVLCANCHMRVTAVQFDWYKEQIT